jgi:multimeric flavodoxin WrbA/nitrite reductase/ring-hydroxylating ferredoxin subunit
MPEPNWQDLGSIENLRDPAVRELNFGRTKIALSYREGQFGAVSGVCNHVGGPLGQGSCDGDYLVCPWHYWKFHRVTGLGEPGYEADRVPSYTLKEEGGHLWIDLASATGRNKAPHQAHPLSRPVVREEGPVRVLGISTTAMDEKHPRYSTSDALLEVAIEHAGSSLGLETRLIRLNDLKFRACEGFYSKSAHACTWPCSITQMDKNDQLDQVYEGIVHWADVILISTPIRWGQPSSLYQKMVERMNCVQNQVTIKNKVLIDNKVAGFLITGGQDNVQAVAGQMMMFFAEIGCQFPQFPFIAHSRGWSAEDMERNMAVVQASEELRLAARELVERAVETSKGLLATAGGGARTVRAGRKAGRAEERP